MNSCSEYIPKLTSIPCHHGIDNYPFKYYIASNMNVFDNGGYFIGTAKFIDGVYYVDRLMLPYNKTWKSLFYE